MSDRRFAIAVVFGCMLVVAGLVAAYVWLLGDQSHAPPPAAWRDQPTGSGRRVKPRIDAATTLPDDLATAIQLPVQEFEPALHAVRVAGKFGYIDESGRIVIQPAFASALPFRSDDTAAASDGRAWGLIDPSGQWVVPPSFPQPPVAIGGAGFQPAIGEAGFQPAIGEAGFQPAIGDRLETCPTTDAFEQLRPFSDGYAAACKSGKWGFVDQLGLWHVPPVYQHVRDFRRFTAAVWSDGKMGFIDRLGRVVLAPAYAMTPEQARFSDFAEKRAAVLVGGKWGYVDRTGRMAVAPQFESARPFSEGLAAVKLDGKWGFIDLAGEMRIVPTFVDVDPADCGDGEYRGGFRSADRLVIAADTQTFERTLLAAAATQAGWGFIGTDGQFVVSPQYRHVGPFRGRLARIVTDAGEGYIDKTGKIIFEPRK